MMSGAVVPAMLPGGIAVLGLLLRWGRRRDRLGPWDVLQELARGRCAVTAERERRATVVQMLDRMDAGGRVDEVDEHGRRRTFQVRPPARGTVPRGAGR